MVRRKNVENERRRQIKKLLEASLPTERRHIRQRDDEGLRWRAELEGKNRDSGAVEKHEIASSLRFSQ